MQQATTMNISSKSTVFTLSRHNTDPALVHVEEFKKLLSAEVHKSMKELGTLREERKALEHQISDLFALKAKFGGADVSHVRLSFHCGVVNSGHSREEVRYL